MKALLPTSTKLAAALVLLTTLSACVNVKDSTTLAPAAKVHVASPEAMNKYQSAIQLMQLGHLDAALKVFEAVSVMDPMLSGPQVNMGLIYLQQDKPQQAKAAFEEALKRKPDNATALMQLGIMQREAFELEAARDSYRKAVAAQPELANAHLNLAILCDIYLRDYGCALEHYQEYQRIKGDDEQVNNWVVDLKERM